MKLIKELFFPTPVYYIDLEGADALNQYLKNRIYSWRDSDQPGIVRSNVKQVGSWHSETTMNQRAEYDLFRDKVTEQINAVFKDQLYSENHEACCLNMWANVNPQHGYNRSHIHPGSLWSGAYYVNTPIHCGRIVFQDPRPESQMLLIEKQKNATTTAEQWSEVYHQAIAGRLVLFPSWLRHEVEPNITPIPSPEGDRISISFNYGQRLKE
ncbi:MAG: TIGR02466 family protein [Pseudomonadota bacterium]